MATKIISNESALYWRPLPNLAKDLMESVGKNGFCGSWQEARDTLRKWREQNVRKSAQTVEIGTYLLQHRSSGRLGNEGEVCSY